MPIHSPTSRNAYAFLARAWAMRGELSPSERKGFSQYFYLTICGHIEAVIASRLQSRLKYLSIFINSTSIPPARFVISGQSSDEPIEPLVNSIQCIVLSLETETRSAPLQKLISLVARVFPGNVKDCLGSEDYDCLLALGALRNLYAHSGELIIEFDEQYNMVLQGSQLERPAKCLRQAGLLSTLNFSGQNWDGLIDVIHSDKAMAFFYKKVQAIEEKLTDFTHFGPKELNDGSIPPLPKIED